MRFYCFQYSLFHIHICILSQRSPDFHVFSVILVLRKNAVPADASAAAITLSQQPAWRGSVLTAAGSRVACPLLWGVWCHGASGAVACLVLWCICCYLRHRGPRFSGSSAFLTARTLHQLTMTKKESRGSFEGRITKEPRPSFICNYMLSHFGIKFKVNVYI